MIAYIHSASNIPVACSRNDADAKNGGKNLRGVIINLYLCDVERCGLPTLSGCGIYRKETIATDKKKEQICHDIQFSHSVG